MLGETNMPAKIENFTDFINSKRFKNGTNHKIFTDGELAELENLYNYAKTMQMIDNSYGIIVALASYEVNDMINRFKFIKENHLQRTKETYIVRYGTKEGEIRWNSYCEKQKVKNLFENKQQKYGWTKEQFSEFNKSRASTKQLMINRYGEEEGKQKWDSYVDRQRYTNSLQYYEEKYGKDAGYEEWLNYNKEKGKSSKLEWLMEKYSVDEVGALEIAASRAPKSASSIAEMLFITDLENALGRSFKYTAKTKQFAIWNKYTDSICFYDLVDSITNKIIEFHGDYWHCNPAKYDANYIHKHSELQAKDIWQKDFTKTKCALERGYQIKIVWWSEYETNRDQIIKECTEWLQK
jgi:hypothetical protein